MVATYIKRPCPICFVRQVSWAFAAILSCVHLALYCQNACEYGCLCVCVCVRTLRIVSKDKILCFKNTLIISISIITSAYSREIKNLALRSCVKVEMNVLGSPSLIVCMVSVDVKQHWWRRISVLVVLRLNVNCPECNCSFCYIRAWQKCCLSWWRLQSWMFKGRSSVLCRLLWMTQTMQRWPANSSQFSCLVYYST